jgi:hypothetical protein
VDELKMIMTIMTSMKALAKFAGQSFAAMAENYKFPCMTSKGRHLAKPGGS